MTASVAKMLLLERGRKSLKMYLIWAMTSSASRARELNLTNGTGVRERGKGHGDPRGKHQRQPASSRATVASTQSTRSLSRHKEMDSGGSGDERQRAA